jgi:hypothetical protein
MQNMVPLVQISLSAEPMYCKSVRRSWWMRLLVACWSLWLTAALAEPAALSACPAHSSHAAHSGHVAADGMQAHHAGHGGDSSKQHSNTHCSCLGECCSAPAAAPPSTTIAVIPVTIVADAARWVAVEAAPASPVPYSHPFANGPPSARSL